MADQTITNLPAVTAPLDTDAFATDQVGDTVTRRETRAQIVSGVVASLQSHESAGVGAHGITAAGLAIATAANAAAQRTALGLGTAAVSNTGDFEAAGAVSTHAALTSSVHGISAFGATLVDDATAGDARTTLGLGDAATATQGSGNGLDADTVDGQEASAFAAASHVHAGGDITSGTVAAARLAVMVGDSGAGGTQGAVPAPGAGDAAAGKFLKADGTWVAPAGGIGGSLGATDNAILRTDGTGGETAQGSGATVDDSGNVGAATGYKIANALSYYKSSGILLIEPGYSTNYIKIFTRSAGYGVSIGENGAPDLPTATLHVFGDLLFQVKVEANTAVAASPNVITATESGTCFTNEGATAENVHDLPAAAAGLQFEFYVQDADGIRINCGSFDSITTTGGTSGLAGFIRSANVGDWIKLRAINGVQWVEMGEHGTWTIDS